MSLSLIYAILTIQMSVYSSTFQLYSWCFYMLSQTSRLFYGSGLSFQCVTKRIRLRSCGRFSDQELKERLSFPPIPLATMGHMSPFSIWERLECVRGKRKWALPHCPSHRALPTAASAARERGNMAPACTWNGRWICIEPPFLFLPPECPPTCGSTSFSISSSPSRLPVALLLFCLMVWACPIKLFPWTVTLEWNHNKTKDSPVWLSGCPSDCLSSLCAPISLTIYLLPVYLSIHFILYIHTSTHWISVTFLFPQDINIVSYCSSYPDILALELHKPAFRLSLASLHDIIAYSKWLSFPSGQPATSCPLVRRYDFDYEICGRPLSEEVAFLLINETYVEADQRVEEIMFKTTCAKTPR